MNPGFAARLGLALGILAGNSLIVMQIMGQDHPAAIAALTVLSLAGLGVFVWNPRSRDEE